jgi:hypothetical protein
MEKKAIALLSGGLDSSLAVKLMIDQGVEVIAVNFTSPFCNCTPKSAGCKHQARLIADQLGVEIHMLPKGMDYLAVVKNPDHGHGRGMNPCIDCRIYMLRKVRERMASFGASFVVTGEVLGQRPMSQHRQAIDTIEKESGLEGLILRPLSAGFFPPTIPEKEGVVDRERLLSLSGRTRRPQMDLADKLGIKDYPCPAGGCLLTDPVIAARLRDLFAFMPDFEMSDIHLLKIGRHFRLGPDLKVVLGRDKAENERIKNHMKPGSIFIEPVNFRGPSAFASRFPEETLEQMIGRMIAHYSKDRPDEYMLTTQTAEGETSTFSVREKLDAEAVLSFQIGPGGQDLQRFDAHGH